MRGIVHDMEAGESSSMPRAAGGVPARRRAGYADFAVRIAPSETGGFVSEVVWAPAGSGSRAPFVPPFDEAEVAVLLRDLGRTLAGGGHGRPRHLETVPRSASRRYDPAEVGLRLFRSLFQGEVGTAFARSRPRPGDPGLRIRLVIDPLRERCAAIAALPWELLAEPNGNGYLGQRPLFAVVRYLEGPDAHGPLPLTGELRVLAAFCSPGGLPRLEADAERSVLRRWGEIPGVRVTVLDPASFDEVRDRLRAEPFHVFHFSGHGGFDGHRGTLAFERDGGSADPIGADLLTAAFDDAPALRLAVLNACDSGRSPRLPGADPFHGVAAALVRSAVPAVVGMQLPISDRAAARFAEALYAALAQGDPVDAAVTDGRLAILRDRTSLEWATPALHLRVADGRLFDRLDPPPPPPPPSAPRRWRRWPTAAAALALLALLAWGAWRAGRPGEPAVQPLVSATDAAGKPEAGAAPDWQCPPHELLPGFEWAWIPPTPLELPPEEPGATTGLLLVARGFCIGRYEITWGQMRSVLGEDLADDGKPPSDTLPAFGVSYELAERFLDRLGGRHQSRLYRLPTGAEWELAARAGSTAAYSFGNDEADLPDHGNCQSRGPKNDGYDDEPAPVGSYPPNAFGLYDVHGNVWEWVGDLPGPDHDPRYRIRRGGGWNSKPATCTASAKSTVQGGIRHRESGFRIVLELTGHYRPRP